MQRTAVKKFMKMMAGSKLFVDTNILIYTSDPRSPYRFSALSALLKATRGGASLVISAQVLREYLAVSTRNRLSNADIHLADIFENVSLFRRRFEVIEDNERVLNHLLELVKDIPTAGKQIYDANIVATMQAHGIHSLLTHNTADFKRFSHLIELLDI